MADRSKRTVSHGFRLRPSEAELIDAVRGTLPRGPWIRDAALSAARLGDVPPAMAPRYENNKDEPRTVHVRPWFTPEEARVISDACKRITDRPCSPADFVRDAALWTADFQANPAKYQPASA